MISGDASSWEELFEQNLVPSVLTLVVTTWGQMPKSGPTDLEDAISDRLFLALRKAKGLNDLPFLIFREDLEFDAELTKVTGRKDIVFYPTVRGQEIYLCLEAKRLNAIISGRRHSLAGEYVTDGMQRFVDGKYARSVLHGAMLGYVLDGDTDGAIRNVKRNIRKRRSELRMDENGDLLKSTIRPDDPLTRETRHHRANKKPVFRIHHLFVHGH